NLENSNVTINFKDLTSITGNINSNCAAGSGIYIWKGGYGQTGGSGGFSGPGGATVPTGGSGGSGGDVSSLTCSSHETIEGSYGSVGINASSVGIGGSGWGGRGGYSGVDEDPTSRLYEEGSLGPNGGGGGAYVKFEVVVSSGESYNFFVGRGGEGGKLICPQQGCDPEWNYISGNGADGLIKISYEIE
ncbi:MAG: hypothetical protein U9R00_01300, partial [Patescibacteria group bacterium]|nr:hypothetical protein [Patescibacteria group bacterium]